MGYYIRNLPNRKSAPTWKLQFISGKKEHTRHSNAQFPKRTWDIPSDRWAELGFHKHMDRVEAVARQRQLNAQLAVKRHEEYRLVIDEKERLMREKCAGFIPTIYRDEFERRYFYNGRAVNQKSLSAWKVAQQLITELQLEPSDWYDSSRIIYRCLLSRKYSLSYCHKILRIMNMWGFFYSRKIGKPFFSVPAPRGHERAQLLEAYFTRRGTDHKESEPLQPAQLESVRGRLEKEHANWLYLSVWLGLRPLEIDQLKNPELIKIMTDSSGVPTLWVYQTKLVAVPPRYRWKLVPLFLPEQRKCLKIIERQNFRRPLTKTVKLHFGNSTNLYGGRKGFTDLMLSKGQNFVHISQWMGHSNIQRTWRNYKSRCLVHYRQNCPPDSFGLEINSPARQ